MDGGDAAVAQAAFQAKIEIGRVYAYEYIGPAGEKMPLESVAYPE